MMSRVSSTRREKPDKKAPMRSCTPPIDKYLGSAMCKEVFCNETTINCYRY
jgi:hypothetical protein